MENIDKSEIKPYFCLFYADNCEKIIEKTNVLFEQQAFDKFFQQINF
jgi:hypothetical protein